jgi:hypothetical protein
VRRVASDWHRLAFCSVHARRRGASLAIEVDLRFETDGDGRAIALVTRSQAHGENRAVRE